MNLKISNFIAQASLILGAGGSVRNAKSNAPHGIDYLNDKINTEIASVKSFSDIDLQTFTRAQGFELLGEGEDDSSGRSVSSAGDVNGDGYADIIIGADESSSGGRFRAGTSYVIFGKAGNMFKDIDLASNLATTGQGFKVFGASESDYSGSSVSSAGDINGDGFDDIIIGAEKADYDGGTSYIIFGKANGFGDIDLADDLVSINQGFKLYDSAAYGNINGPLVASAGDINGDGYDDIIIGASVSSAGGVYLSAATSYIIFGKESGFSDIDLANDLVVTNQGFKVYDAAYNDYSGSSVSGAGDVNGDGYADMVIGAYGSDHNGRTDAGTSYIIFGKAAGFGDIYLADDLAATNQGFKVYGGTTYDNSGSSVSLAGDINGDGFDDVIIGAYGAEDDAGASFVIFGNSSVSDIDLANDLVSTNQGFKVFGAAPEDSSGYSVSGAGDVNGDGFGDVIIGSYRADPDGRGSAGTSYVIFGRANSFSNIYLADDLATTNQGFKVYGAAAGDNSGEAVSGAGDFNGDGYDDVIIGAPEADSDGRAYAGISYVILESQGTFAPTYFPTLAPKSVSPTASPTAITESTWFTALYSVTSFFVSIAAGWIMREKVAFHILSNWGYDYKLMYKGSPEQLKAGEVGFSLIHSKSSNTDKLICKHGDKKITVNLDDGSNNGLPEGIYNIIMQELKSPQGGVFTLMQS